MSVEPEQAKEPARPRGAARIAELMRTLPASPGVYRMLAADGEVLYVGKARSLRKRVQSYARAHGHTDRIARMIAATAEMEFVTTATETEALLLEANLIKRLKPRFNVILRDDKSFPHILIARDHPAPQILKHRGARARPGDYFGPFASAGAVNRTLNTLERAFLLRSCSDAVYESRTRPCLLYQIRRCSAPCTGEIGLDDYAGLVRQATDFLSGRSQAVQAQIAAQMEDAAGRLDFERAAVYRDRLAALAQIRARQDINARAALDADIFAAHQAAGQTCIQVFFFRNGQNWGNRAYFPRADRTLPAAEVLGAFLAQFYDDRPSPPQVLLSHAVPDQALLADALATKAGHKVEVLIPRRGEKRQIVEHVLANARDALGRRLAETGSQAQLLARLAEAFGLPAAPERIEVFDNSHIQGAHALGAMIVAGPEGFAKAHYRKFNIRTQDLAPGDDYAMMREVLGRRFARLKRGTESDGPAAGGGDDMPGRPDLVVIDGGKGQLAVAEQVLAGLGLAGIALIAIAKGPERDAGRDRFFMPGRAPFMLEPRDPVLYFVQRLRDEAHRFAVGAHRARRKAAMGASPLDEVPGIGAARKRALLRHFGSARAVSRAGTADLRTVPGISAQMAQTIYDFFHDRMD